MNEYFQMTYVGDKNREICKTKTQPPLVLLNLIAKDERLNSEMMAIENPDEGISRILSKYKDIIFEYTSALDITFDSFNTILRELLHSVVLVTVATHKEEDAKKGKPKYNIFFLQLLAMMQEIIEISILGSDINNEKSKNVKQNLEKSKIYRNIPNSKIIIPKQQLLDLMRVFWALFIVIYIWQLRPHIDGNKIHIAVQSLGCDIPSEENIWGEIHCLLFEEELNPMLAHENHVKYDFHIYKGIRCLLFASRFLESDLNLGTSKFENSYFFSKAAYLMARSFRQK